MLKSNYSGLELEAGCDEAGRGCLAGPVFAAAVILPLNYQNEQLNDSKKLNHNQRSFLRTLIENDAVAWAVASIDQQKIDEINILNASILAMHNAVQKLTSTPHYLIVDGNRFKSINKIPFHCIVKGDGKYLSIAAASILAKTFRDEYMGKIHSEYPEYRWDKNKGYPTPEHKKAISKFGISPYHRKSFRINNQLKFDFQ